MPKTRAELDAQLESLKAALPALLESVSEDCQLDAFASLADDISGQAGSADAEHVWSRVQCILRDAGLIPGDDEPCA